MSNLLNIGYTGLSASKKSLETTGHNLSNVNTEGYSRQRVEQSTNIPISKGGILSGSGVRVKRVSRVHDQFIEKRFRDALSENKSFHTQSEKLFEVENIFNEIDSEGLNKVLNKFYNSFRELGNQPENETIRSMVRENANLVVKDIKRIRESLDTIARNIDNKLKVEINGVNQLLDQIAQLNIQITALEGSSGETGDLRDQRDRAISRLAESFKVHSYYNDKNQLIVSAQGIGTLVTGGVIQKLGYSTTSREDSSNNMPASLELYYEGRPNNNLSNKFPTGVISSLFSTRNGEIRGLQDTMDRIAFDFINTVNAVHRRGFVNREIETDANNNPIKLNDSNGPVTGINFFTQLSQSQDAAKFIEISKEVNSDLSNITTSLAPNSPGDNRVAIGISKLQHEKVMAEGTATLEEYFLQTIGDVGLRAGKANLDFEQSDGVLSQVKNLKERTSGVSIDEETANMVRYQHAYEASAKVMQTANDMFETVLSLKAT